MRRPCLIYVLDPQQADLARPQAMAVGDKKERAVVPMQADRYQPVPVSSG